MHRHTRSETGAGELSSPRSSRAASFSSDRPSVAGSVTFQMPSSVRPAPAYIAASVASEVVTEHINKQLNNDSSADALENALFSEQALRLLNAFLDHLLFAFLSSARSPSLTAIRPAITDVLKPRLAREAFVTADDELQGLLAGDDDEEFPSAEHGNTPGRWDVEKVWKRTRLRIMVYTRLGELEDDDEERYVQQEKGLSMDESDDDEANLVSWASAIFLTSVVEYIAEQSLVVSGQAAYARTSAKMKKHAQPTADGEEQQLERIVVEDFDVEKIALNAGLGRLWRTWRKRVRSPITPISPTRGPRYMTSFSSLHRRRVSHDTNGDESIISNDMREVSEYEPTETEIAANIPLPMTENDVAEIEVPGLARQPDDESSGTETPVPRPQRPSSFIMLAPADGFRKHVLRERPVSMPPPASGEFIVSPRFESPQDESPQDESPQAESELESPQAESELESPQAESELESPQVESSPAEHPTPARTEGEVFETPMERMSDDDSYIHDERQEDIPQEQTASPEQVVIPEQKAAPERKVTPHVPRVTVPDTEQDSDNDPDMVAFAASTGMGFGMSPITPTKSTDLDKEGEDTIETPTQTGYDKEPQVFESKRMSIEKSKPPSIVRTFSTRSNRSSGHVPTPEGRPTPEGNSYLDDAPSDEDVSGPEAIGIAHTSNRAIPATPSPPAESASRPPSIVRAPERNSTDHVSPRHFATPTTVARKTPSPEEKPQPERPAPHKDISPLSPPKTRGAALPALQESEVVAPKRHTSEALQPGSSRQSPKQGSSRFREAQPTAAAITTARRSVESSPRSKNAARDSFPVEKSTLKRVSSSSSTNKSVGTSILHSGRDSDVSIGRPRGLSGRMSEEDREREFDSLVKSPETVKYTLTPQSMRDLDEPPVVRKPEHKSSASVTVYPPVKADKDNSFGAQPLPTRTSSRSRKSQPVSNNKFIGSKPLAREPRIQTESMRDFADFIRSTGPAPGEDSKPVQPFVSLAESKSPAASPSAISGLGRKLSTRQSSNKPQPSPSDSPSAKARHHMEPRSPSGPRSGNDDLIDFIRQGPPGANNGQPRIPRSVAPFRSTVDSDQFERMLDDNNANNVESAYGSQVSTTSRVSNQTANSRTGLLPAAHVVQPAYSNKPQNLSGSMGSPEPQVQRTRRRVKDPYAIDSDDEDEDLLTALPKSNGGQRKEESIMDFLNSQEPSTNSEPQPFILNEATVAAAKARLSQNGPHYTSAKSPAAYSPTGARNGSGPRKPQSNQSAVISSSITSDAPRAHKPKLQARTAAGRESGRSATNDLADFLRTSGPSEPAAPPPGATIRKEESSKKLNAKFWKKKTYPDMP